MSNFVVIAHVVVGVVFARLYSVIVMNPIMLRRKGKYSHALFGVAHLTLLSLLYVDAAFIVNDRQQQRVMHLLLGIVGVLLPLTAARDFDHSKVKNSASGTLDPHATVTRNEMIEHSFYQFLNLIQIAMIHLFDVVRSIPLRAAVVLLATTPWLGRSMLPVNSFSKNYTVIDARSTNFVRLLYRLKKYQYVFYKHALLHGLNVSLALLSSQKTLIDQQLFLFYWADLNASYVLEFFLQTLVKKSFISQRELLIHQQLLMFAASVAASFVLFSYVNPFVVLLSLALNFLNRGHEFINVLTVVVVTYIASTLGLV